MSWVFEYFPRPFVRRAFVLFHRLFNLRLPTGNLFALSTLSSLTLYIFLKYQIRPSAWKLDNLQICCFFVNSIFVKYRNMFIYIHIWHVQQLASGSRLIFGLIKHVLIYQNNMVVCCFGFQIQSHSVQVHKGLVLLWNIYFHCIWNICLAVSHRLSTETLLLLQQVARHQSKVCFQPQP